MPVVMNFKFQIVPNISWKICRGCLMRIMFLQRYFFFAATKLLTPNLCFMCIAISNYLFLECAVFRFSKCFNCESPNYFLHAWVACNLWHSFVAKKFEKGITVYNKLVLELVSWKNEVIKCWILGLESNLSMDQLAYRNEKYIYVIGWY
jgi:hypothetical protein